MKSSDDITIDSLKKIILQYFPQRINGNDRIRFDTIEHKNLLNRIEFIQKIDFVNNYKGFKNKLTEDLSDYIFFDYQMPLIYSPRFEQRIYFPNKSNKCLVIRISILTDVYCLYIDNEKKHRQPF